MEKLITFLTVISWISGIISTIWFFSILIKVSKYEDSFRGMVDRRLGVDRTSEAYTYARKCFVVAIVCWTFIIVF